MTTLADLARHRRPMPASEQTAESARILIALVRREMTLPEALRALPGQMPMERAA